MSKELNFSWILGPNGTVTHLCQIMFSLFRTCDWLNKAGVIIMMRKKGQKSVLEAGAISQSRMEASEL